MPRGRFITVEGVDGAGKSSQLPVLVEALRAAGHQVLLTREPGGTALGEALRRLLLDVDEAISPRAEALLMFAARAQHVDEVIAPALAGGQWVVCDRFSDASHAYQGGGRGLDTALLRGLEDIAHPGLQPDHTLLFDIAPELAASRMGSDRDRFEQEGGTFFARVRAAYLHRAKAEPRRFSVIDGGRPLHEVGDTVRRLAARLAAGGPA